MLVDSWYDTYLGVMVLVRIIDGVLKKGQRVRMMRTGAVYEVDAQWVEDAYDQRITFERGPAAQAKIVDEQCSAATVAATGGPRNTVSSETTSRPSDAG